MTKAGERLLSAANEALQIAKGEADASTYVVHRPPETIDVRALRKSMNMTQLAFGERFGFGKARVRDWEQKRTKPHASDRVLLTTIQYAPEVVLSALAAGATEARTLGIRSDLRTPSRRRRTDGSRAVEQSATEKAKTA